jgi:hypothetical protein
VLVDLAGGADDVVGGGGSCGKEGMGLDGALVMRIVGRKGTEGGREGYNVGLPLVTLKLVRGTTALEVKAPPVHCKEGVN